MSLQDYRYLIIGGAPKSGTTSIYSWLTGHPQICASRQKEVRFFLEPDYPLSSFSRYDGNNLNEYESCFPTEATEGKVRLDATPDYMYSSNAPKIAELLPQAKMIVILRDPVERMVSWYKFARQRDLIAKEMSFADYFEIQVAEGVGADTPTHLRALEQNRYEKYLPALREAFGERLLELSFEDLKTAPGSLMQRICEFSGLDGEYYRSYSFNPENVSRLSSLGMIENRYNTVRRNIAQLLHRYPTVIMILKMPHRVIKTILNSAKKTTEQVEVSQELAARIRSHSTVNGKSTKGEIQV